MVGLQWAKAEEGMAKVLDEAFRLKNNPLAPFPTELSFNDRLSPATTLARLKGTIARLVGTAIRTRPRLPPCVHLPMMRALLNGTIGCHASALVPIRTSDDLPCPHLEAWLPKFRA